jgi:hypothetical protein
MGQRLDWKTNDYAFHLLTRSIIDSVDSEYREKYGIRVDQLASQQEIHECFRTCRGLYEKDLVFQVRGIYFFLRVNMMLWLGGKVCKLLNKRRDVGKSSVGSSMFGAAHRRGRALRPVSSFEATSRRTNAASWLALASRKSRTSSRA